MDGEVVRASGVMAVGPESENPERVQCVRTTTDTQFRGDRVRLPGTSASGIEAIGGSLDAEVCIMPLSDAGREILAAFAEELRFLLIVSEATVVEGGEAPDEAVRTDDYAIWVRRSEAEKCVRCWHRRSDVGADPQHPELCGRCVENVDGPGETRRMA